MSRSRTRTTRHHIPQHRHGLVLGTVSGDVRGCLPKVVPYPPKRVFNVRGATCMLASESVGKPKTSAGILDRVGRCHVMKRGLLQYLGDVRGGACLLLLAFLLLAYVVDIAYYEDFEDGTPTRYTQNSNEETIIDSSDDPASPLCAETQSQAGEAGFMLQDAGTLCRTPARTVVSPHYLFVASLTSRPPPVL